MLEIPEAFTIARQLSETVVGKTIVSVKTAQSPHKFAFFSGDPLGYEDLLQGERIAAAAARGGMVELRTEHACLAFSDGVNLRFHEPGADRPEKHQLLLVFEGGSALSASVQMYGGLWAFREGEFDNPYYEAAKSKPSPLEDSFDIGYFEALLDPQEIRSLSLKAFLATEQRIPGLGNGVLQDILWTSRLHPKRKVTALSENERLNLFEAIKEVLQQMASIGGRDTEKDLFGRSGGYKTAMSSLRFKEPCPACGGRIVKEAYMGGRVYYCPQCQKN